MSDPEYIGRIARSIAPCGLVCALCGKPSCKGCGRVRMPSFPVCAASVLLPGRKASPDAGNARFFPAGRA